MKKITGVASELRRRILLSLLCRLNVGTGTFESESFPERLEEPLEVRRIRQTRHIVRHAVAHERVGPVGKIVSSRHRAARRILLSIFPYRPNGSGQ